MWVFFFYREPQSQIIENRILSSSTCRNLNLYLWNASKFFKEPWPLRLYKNPPEARFSTICMYSHMQELNSMTLQNFIYIFKVFVKVYFYQGRSFFPKSCHYCKVFHSFYLSCVIILDLIKSKLYLCQPMTRWDCLPRHSSFPIWLNPSGQTHRNEPTVFLQAYLQRLAGVEHSSTSGNRQEKLSLQNA